jgi:hypothetical protein
MTNTHTNVENRLSVLERSNNRWRLGAIGATALLAGLLIGGMGQPAVPAQGEDPKAVVGVAGTEDTIFRIHQDGSITYLKINNGKRSAQGLFDWGNVLIDRNYRNIDKR